MTLGRKNGKLKIKTDTPKGLRSVECACCGGCGFSPFSPSPINTTKAFKYLTYEASITPYDVGVIDQGLESWGFMCAPALDEDGNEFFTCSPYGKTLRTQAESFQIKTTQALSRDCSTCNIVKAWGTHSKEWELWDDDGCFFTDDMTCWKPVLRRRFVSTLQDTQWSTWSDGEGKIYLDEITSPAIWNNSICVGNDGVFFPQEGHPKGGVWGWGDDIQNPTDDINGYGYPVCPGAPGCVTPSISGTNWTYAGVVEGGGFRVAQREGNVGSVVLYDDVFDIEGTIRYTLHNTLGEIWGTVMELRP